MGASDHLRSKSIEKIVILWSNPQIIHRLLTVTTMRSVT